MTTKDYKDRAASARPVKTSARQLPGVAWFVSGIALGTLLIGVAWSTLGPGFIWNGFDGKAGDKPAVPVVETKPGVTAHPETATRAVTEKPVTSFSFNFPKTLQDQRVEVPKADQTPPITPTLPPPALAPFSVVIAPDTGTTVSEPADLPVTEPDADPQTATTQREDSTKKPSSTRDSSKRHSSTNDSPKKDSPKRHSSTNDSPKKDSSRRDASKNDSPKRDSAKNDAPQRASSKKDSAKNDTSQRTSSKKDSAKNDSHKSEEKKKPNQTSRNTTNGRKPETDDGKKSVTAKPPTTKPAQKKVVGSTGSARKKPKSTATKKTDEGKTTPKASNKTERKEEPKPKPKSTALQVGAFQSQEDARRMRARMALLGVETEVQETKTRDNKVVHRLRTNPQSSGGDLEETRRLLRSNNIRNFAVGDR